MVKKGVDVQPEIESGIEIPTRRINEADWQLAEKMEAGDSVVYDTIKKARGLRVKLGKLGAKSALREVDGGFRVWKK